MRLSEAIREGSKNTTQCFGSLYGNGGLGKEACALGAAMSAVNNVVQWDDFGQLPNHCPEGCDDVAVLDWHEAQSTCWERPKAVVVWNVISHLNDAHRWTREQIADWVQAQEAIHDIGQEATEPMRELVNA